MNDWLAGWLLSGSLPAEQAWGRVPWLVIYAGLAFAGQIPAAWLIERIGHLGRWLAGALALVVLAALVASAEPGLAIVLSGLASAVVHVAGGALALGLPRGEWAIGWFAAPGILGLTIGGLMGATCGEPQRWAALPALLLLAGWWMLRRRWPQPQVAEQAEHTPTLEAHDGLMLLLLLVLSLRSALWDLAQRLPIERPEGLVAIALAAATGKVMGGWMASRWPGFRPVAAVLLLSCTILEWSREKLAGLCVGVALLQSAIPASIILLRRHFGTSPARSSAYAFGATVALGGLVLPLRWSYTGVALGLGVLSLGLMGPSLRKTGRGGNRSVDSVVGRVAGRTDWESTERLPPGDALWGGKVGTARGKRAG